MSCIFNKFKSLIEEKKVNQEVLWDKIHDIIKKRDEKDLGIDFDSVDICDPLEDDKQIPSLEEILNQLIILDITTNPEEHSELENQLKSRNLDYLVEFLAELQEADVMSYLTEDMSFDNLSQISNSEFDCELEAISFLVSEGIRRASMTITDYGKDCDLELIVESDGLFILMDKKVVNFKQQDVELQMAILDKLRDNSFVVIDNFCC